MADNLQEQSLKKQEEQEQYNAKGAAEDVKGIVDDVKSIKQNVSSAKEKINEKKQTSKNAQDASNKNLEQGLQKSTEQSMQKGAEQGVKKGTEGVAKKGTEQGIQKAADKSMQKGAEQGIQKAADKGVQKGAEQGVKRGTEGVAKKGAEEVAKKGTEEVAKKGTEQVAKQAAQQAAKQTAQQAAQQVAAQTATQAAVQAGGQAAAQGAASAIGTAAGVATEGIGFIIEAVIIVAMQVSKGIKKKLNNVGIDVDEGKKRAKQIGLFAIIGIMMIPIVLLVIVTVQDAQSQEVATRANDFITCIESSEGCEDFYGTGFKIEGYNKRLIQMTRPGGRNMSEISVKADSELSEVAYKYVWWNNKYAIDDEAFSAGLLDLTGFLEEIDEANPFALDMPVNQPKNVQNFKIRTTLRYFSMGASAFNNIKWFIAGPTGPEDVDEVTDVFTWDQNLREIGGSNNKDFVYNLSNAKFQEVGGLVDEYSIEEFTEEGRTRRIESGLKNPDANIFGITENQYISMLEPLIPAWIEPFATYAATGDWELAERIYSFYEESAETSPFEVALYPVPTIEVEKIYNPRTFTTDQIIGYEKKYNEETGQFEDDLTKPIYATAVYYGKKPADVEPVANEIYSLDDPDETKEMITCTYTAVLLKGNAYEFKVSSEWYLKPAGDIIGEPVIAGGVAVANEVYNFALEPMNQGEEKYTYINERGEEVEVKNRLEHYIMVNYMDSYNKHLEIETDPSLTNIFNEKGLCEDNSTPRRITRAEIEARVEAAIGDREEYEDISTWDLIADEDLREELMGANPDMDWEEIMRMAQAAPETDGYYEDMKIMMSGKNAFTCDGQKHIIPFYYNIDSVSFAIERSNEYYEKVKQEVQYSAEGVNTEYSAYLDYSGLTGGQFVWPVPESTSLTQCFGMYESGGEHNGIDIGNGGRSRYNTFDIVASADGVVERVNAHCTDFNNYGSNCGSGWGNYVLINHNNGYKTRYSHLEFGSIVVSEGENVVTGQKLGKMGSSGNSTGIHLDFELWHDGTRIDPTKGLMYGIPPNAAQGKRCQDTVVYQAVPTTDTSIGIAVDWSSIMSGGAGSLSNSSMVRDIQTDYGVYITKWATYYGLDPNLVVAMIAQESSGDHLKENGSSIGLMQWEFSNGTSLEAPLPDGTTETISSITASRLRNNPDFQIRVGCAELASKTKDAYGNPLVALQGYNFGVGGIRRCISYHIAGHKNAGERYCGVSQDAYIGYVRSGDTEWIEDTQWYYDTGCTEFGAWEKYHGDANYISNILRYYNPNGL